jgi:ribose transport system permease protein
MLASRVQAAQPSGGEIFTLYATAAVILGGTSLYGGRGSMLRTLLGVALITLLENGLELLGVPYSNQQIAVGLVFIIAASSEFLHRRR